jgi:transposase
MAWTEITRAKYRRDGLRYASDTTDEEWSVIEPHLPNPASCGRTRQTDLRDVVDAIFYIAQSGCQWRMIIALLHDNGVSIPLPPSEDEISDHRRRELIELSLS